ncbi:MAG: hypothetical protein EBT92_11055 [Planctomycetes bacterium]|nr:hypothetical protein [Planctomycetota bacterium]NBY01818.1 hypothetical protein [Planctomycetota bacterium]
MQAKDQVKANIEHTDVNFKVIVVVGVILGLMVMLGFFIGLHLFNFLVAFENARKVSEYPLVAKEISDNEASLLATIIKEAEIDSLDRNKKSGLINPKNEAEKKEREEILAKDPVFKEAKEQIQLTFTKRQDNRIFTTGYFRPAHPGPAYADADVNLYKQGTDKAASDQAIAKGEKSKIIVSRLEGIDPLRPMMSGISGWPSYAKVSKEAGEEELKNRNLEAGIKSFAKKYMEQNKEFHTKNKISAKDSNDFVPSDSSAGRLPEGNAK